jgi:hypothetical protein
VFVSSIQRIQRISNKHITFFFVFVLFFVAPLGPGAYGIVIGALSKHRNSASIAREGCRAIRSLCMENRVTLQRLFDADVCETITGTVVLLLCVEKMETVTSQ